MFRADQPLGVLFHLVDEGMPVKLSRETTIERIYRDVTGRKMPVSIKRILLPNRKQVNTAQVLFGLSLPAHKRMPPRQNANVESRVLFLLCVART
jgi:hypothetical protein